MILPNEGNEQVNDTDQNLLIIEDGCPGKTELKACYKSMYFGLAAPWAQEAIKKALHNRLMGRTIPPFARKNILDAVRHLQSTQARIEREAAQADRFKVVEKTSHKRNQRAIDRGRTEYANRMGTRTKKSK